MVQNFDFLNNDQTGGRIIHFCLLYEKVRDSYFEYFGVEDGILLLVRLRIALLVEQVIDLRYLTMAIVALRYTVMMIRLVEVDDDQTDGKIRLMKDDDDQTGGK